MNIKKFSNFINEENETENIIAIKHDGDGIDGYSVLIKDIKNDISLWVDVYANGSDNELTTDWNKYIFHLDDPDDVAIKKYQEENWDEPHEKAVDYLLDNDLLLLNSSDEAFFI